MEKYVHRRSDRHLEHRISCQDVLQVHRNCMHQSCMHQSCMQKMDWRKDSKIFLIFWKNSCISIFEEKKKINCRALCNKKRMY